MSGSLLFNICFKSVLCRSLKAPAVRQVVTTVGADDAGVGVETVIGAVEGVTGAVEGAAVDVVIAIRSGSNCSANRNDSFFEAEAKPNWLR